MSTDNIEKLKALLPDTVIVTGWLELSTGSILGYATTNENQRKLLRGQRFLDLTSALKDAEFYKVARLQFDELEDFYYCYDNLPHRALSTAIDKFIEAKE